MTHTPATIEGIPSEDFRQIMEAAKELREATPHVLETPMSAADAENEEALREAMENKLSDLVGSLQSQKDDIKHYITEAQSVKRWTATDKKRLTSYKFQIIRTKGT